MSDTEEMGSPAVPGIDTIYLGVDELAPSVRVFRDGLGWSVVGYDVVPAEDARALWDVDAPAEVLSLAPAPGCPGGRVDLLRFPSLDVAAQGAPQPLRSYGCTAISVYARDVASVASALERAGGRRAGEGVRFAVPRGDGVAHNVAVLVEVPGDLNILVVNAEDPRPTWTAEYHPEQETTEINLLLYRTPLWRETVTWWGPEGLGLDRAVEVKVGGPLGARLFGTVTGLDIDNAVTTNQGASRLEIHGPDRASEPDEEGDLRARQWPARALGPVLWSIALPERPADFAAWARVRKADVVRSPERRASGHFGTDAVGIIAGPDGHRVQVRIPG